MLYQDKRDTDSHVAGMSILINQYQQNGSNFHASLYNYENLTKVQLTDNLSIRSRKQYSRRRGLGNLRKQFKRALKNSL